MPELVIPKPKKPKKMNTKVPVIKLKGTVKQPKVKQPTQPKVKV